MGIRSYAQNFEDVMLWRALSQVGEGFFIDIGAQHPSKDSVSKAFSERGWQGIHVEPTPAFAAMLREDRHEDTVIQAIVSGHRAPATFYVIGETGLSTGQRAIAEMHAANQHSYRQIVVPSLSLDELLSLPDNQDIHWLKIDVEGMEKDVLESWQTSPVRPWIIVIEAHLPASQHACHDQWEATLVNKGYHHVYSDGLNRFYTENNHRELDASFKYPPNIFDGFQLAKQSDYAVDIRRETDRQELTFQHDLGAANEQRILAEQAYQLQADELSAQATYFKEELARLADANHDRERAALDLIATITQRESNLEARLKLLSEQASHRDAWIKAITKSRSWRFAAPLRRLFRETAQRYPFDTGFRSEIPPYPSPAIHLVSELPEAGLRELPQQSIPPISHEHTSMSLDTNDNLVNLLAAPAGEFVRRCYSLLLGRLPDATEQSIRESTLRSGFGRVRMLIDVEGSAERAAFLKNQLTQGDDEEFINWLYMKYLGRTADPDGLAHFLKLLQNADRHQVRSDVLRSKEARSPQTVWSEISQLVTNERRARQWWRWRRRNRHNQRMHNLQIEVHHRALQSDLAMRKHLEEVRFLNPVNGENGVAIGEHARHILRRMQTLSSYAGLPGETF